MTTTSTIAIAPVRKSIVVKADQAHAFSVFTAGLDRWWPKQGGIGPTPRKAVLFEGRLGGRWYELAEDGTETTVGRVLEWDPPNRFLMSWDINAKWKPDLSVSSEVEVRFIAAGPGATRVELEHRKFERMGEADGATMRKSVDGGWPVRLDEFKIAAEA